MAKLQLVLNRANSKVKLDVGEVERTLQIKADALIPSDIVVPQSVNKGMPVVLDAPEVRRGQGHRAARRHVPAGRRRKRRRPVRRPSRGANADVAVQAAARGPASDHGTGSRPRPGARRAAPEDPPPPDRGAGPDPLRQAAVRGGSAPARSHEQLHAAPGPGERAALGGRQGAADPGRHRRHPRLRPDRPLPQGPGRHRSHGATARSRSTSSARASSSRPTSRSSTRPTCAASSTRSSARSAVASTSRRRWSTPACPTAPVSTR